MSNKQLLKTKEAKNDEFYTTLQTVEKEINNYDICVFADKTIYCNTDCFMSAFTIFFRQNFERLKLKKLICTGLNKNHRYSDTVIVDKSGTQKIRIFKPYHAKDVANFLVNLNIQDCLPISNTILQKILYCAQEYYLKKFYAPLFDFKILPNVKSKNMQKEIERIIEYNNICQIHKKIKALPLFVLRSL